MYIGCRPPPSPGGAKKGHKGKVAKEKAKFSAAQKPDLEVSHGPVKGCPGPLRALSAEHAAATRALFELNRDKPL